MITLERIHLKTLNEGLNEVYNAYRNMTKYLNEVARSGTFYPETLTVNITDAQRREMKSVMLNELSRIEDTVEEFKSFLRWMSGPSAEKEAEDARDSGSEGSH